MGSDTPPAKKKGWLRFTKPHEDNPMLDNVLTFMIAFMLTGLLVGLLNQGVSLFCEFMFYGVVSLFIGEQAKTFFMYLAPKIGVEKNVSKPRNVRKFGHQMWHGVIHTTMTIAECYILGRPEVNWRWWNDIQAEDSTWESTDHAADPLLRSFYLLQLSLWSFMAISHRFHESRHKDYFVMFGHHIATVTLIAVSWWAGTLRIGLLVLLIHDSSDIIVDFLKSSNYLGYDSSSGVPLAEIGFAANYVSWAYSRLWLFPTHLIYSTYYGIDSFNVETDPGARMMKQKKLQLCLALLSTVCIMSYYWFWLFVKMGIRLATMTTADVTKDDYEGDPDVDSDVEQEEPKKK